jgi:predicted AlkP superfamily pyrophosphatase or phosphodiesterase
LADELMSTTRFAAAIGALTLTAAMSVGCVKARYMTAAAPAARPQEQPASRLTPHVVLVSVDGLRPDAIGAFRTPVLDRLMREGAYSLSATTIMPSKTLPSHTSMLTGQPPERHGVLWNSVMTADADLIEAPTIFGIARARGYRTAAFFSKAKFQPLQQPDALDYSQAPGGWFGQWSSDRTMKDVTDHLAASQPSLLFIHLSDPDDAGHRARWMSPDYGRAVSAADEAIGDLVTAADAAFGKAGYTLIVTADHGGHGYDHGTDDPRDVRIPWIAWGRGVRAGQLQDVPVSTIDTASTVLWLLGVSEPADWAGSPIVHAFDAPVSVD